MLATSYSLLSSYILTIERSSKIALDDITYSTLWIILSFFIGALVVCGILGLILSRASNASFPSLKLKHAGELQNTTILTRANIAFTFQQSQGELVESENLQRYQMACTQSAGRRMNSERCSL